MRGHPIERRDADICVEQISQSNNLRLGGFGCLRPFGNSCSASNRLNSASHSAGSEGIGSSNTPPATFRTRTLSPSKRNSFGRRTAWLLPFRNNFATLLFAMPKVYTKSICQINPRKPTAHAKCNPRGAWKRAFCTLGTTYFFGCKINFCTRQFSNSAT